MCAGIQLSVNAVLWGRGQMTLLNTHTHRAVGEQLVGRPTVVGHSAGPLALAGQETRCVCKHSGTKRPLRGNIDTHTGYTHTHNERSPELKQQTGNRRSTVGPVWRPE